MVRGGCARGGWGLGVPARRTALERCRTARVRFVAGRPQSEWGDPQLFDLDRDPGETVNVAGRTEYAEMLDKLAARMSRGWGAFAAAQSQAC